MPKVAEALADEALANCDERWKTPVVQGSARLVADAPVGEVDTNRPSKVFRGHGARNQTE